MTNGWIDNESRSKKKGSKVAFRKASSGRFIEEPKTTSKKKKKSAKKKSAKKKK